MGVEVCLAAVNTRLRNSVPHAKSAVAGSPLLRSGTIEGKVRGGFVTGVVKDESGEVAATFTGRVNPDGTMSGTYTDRTGEVASWQWPDSAQIGQAEE